MKPFNQESDDENGSLLQECVLQGLVKAHKVQDLPQSAVSALYQTTETVYGLLPDKVCPLFMVCSVQLKYQYFYGSGL